MTSIYATKLPGAAGIGLLSDGALVDPTTGILAGVVPKLWSTPGRSFAVAMHGHPYCDETVASAKAAAGLPSFDHAFDAINYALACELMAGHPEDRWRTFMIGILLVGYSEAEGGWRMAYANFSNCPGQPVAPWSLTDAGDEWSRGPVLSVEEMRPLFVGVSAIDEAALRDRGADFFEAQRSKPLESPGFAPYFGVGGYVDLTIVDNDGVRQERLRPFPDFIGRPIAA